MRYVRVYHVICQVRIGCFSDNGSQCDVSVHMLDMRNNCITIIPRRKRTLVSVLHNLVYRYKENVCCCYKTPNTS